MGRVVATLDAEMTKVSPHTIGGLSSLWSAIWKQCPWRRAGAGTVVAEIKESIQGMVGTTYECTSRLEMRRSTGF
jgi:hypothetical protein